MLLLVMLHRIQLAVLDHNSHLNRKQRQHSDTEAYLYHHWDVALQAKEYG